MKTVTGIFTSFEEARGAVEGLRSISISDENISFLTPGASRQEVHGEVPTTETEQPGMGKAVGGVVGMALGTAGGSQLGMATASAFLPGVGWVVGAGLAAAALAGVGGAIGGAAVGGAIENMLSSGLPKDELFVYEDALRQGRTVIVALATDEEQAEKARSLFNQYGAESIDAAREQWWVGLRDAEEEEYRGDGGDFSRDEQEYRRGFEVALEPKTRGRRYEEVAGYLQEHYPGLCEKDSFRRGYERGQLYYGTFSEGSSEAMKREMPASMRPAARKAAKTKKRRRA